MPSAHAVETGGRASLPSAMWVAGAAVANAVFGQILFALVIGGAMVVVVTFGLEQATGAPLYLVASALLVVAHAAVIHAMVRIVSRQVRVPWLIWPGMLVCPATIVGIAVLGNGVIEAFPGMVALLSTALAFVSLGKKRWS